MFGRDKREFVHADGEFSIECEQFVVRSEELRIGLGVGTLALVVMNFVGVAIVEEFVLFLQCDDGQCGSISTI
jgi:hypothetical protein